ncbi:MAG: hypothetical protein ACQER4_08775, partial [Bacteroidota bacterium]
SESLMLNRNGWNGITETEEAISRIQQELDRRQIPYDIYPFSRSVDSLTQDSLWESATRFDAVFEHLRDQTATPPAALLLSDGLDTDYRRDEFTFTSSLPPLYTVSLGATEAEQDLVLEEVLLPNPLELHQQNQLWVRVSRSRLDVSSATIELHIDGELNERTSVSFPENDSVTVQSIPVSLQDTGRIVVEVQVLPRQEEWSTENNHWQDERRVRDNRTNIWHVATSIHPDIRWVREQLRSDRQLRAHTIDLFHEPVHLPDDDPDLIILHGDPRSGPWPDSLTRYLDETGVIWLAGPSGVSLPDMQNGLYPPARPDSNENSLYIRTFSDIVEESRDHPLIEPFQAWLGEANTPLWIHAAEWQTEAATETIWMQGDPNLPFLFLQEVGDRRRLLISATGWYQLSHSGREQEIELAQELFSSILQWIDHPRADTENRRLVEETGTDWTQRIREHHPSGRDDAFLQQLSRESGGEWRSMNTSGRSEEWLDALEQRIDRDRETRYRISIHPYPFWYLLLLLLLASEWIIRRRFRMM